MNLALWIIAGSMLLVAFEGLWSYFVAKNFTPRQVRERWGMNGIPLGLHGGFWGDGIFLPFLFAFIALRYGESWTDRQIATMIGFGILVTLANHLLLIFTQKIPDPFGWQKEWFSVPIALHFVYMSAAVALAGLFYFSTPQVSVEAAALVSILLGVHMTFGIHIPLGLLNMIKKWSWCPEFLHSQAIVMLVVIWSVLAVFAGIAAGVLAGIFVGVIFVGTFQFVMLYVHSYWPR